MRVMRLTRLLLGLLSLPMLADAAPASTTTATTAATPVITTLSSPAPAVAPIKNAPVLQPFRATYAATLNGIPSGVKVSVDLRNEADQNWVLALNASSGLLKYHEESNFRWQQCQVKPTRYRYDFSGIGMKRKLWLDFNQVTRRATGINRKGPLEYDFPADMTDELSLTLAARCQFADGAPQTTFNVATTKGMRKLTYRLEGKETVDTPWGKVDALRIQRVREAGDSRRSTLWIAPSLSYLMVKMEHVEKLGVRGTVALKTLEIAADAAAELKPVTAR